VPLSGFAYFGKPGRVLIGMPMSGRALHLRDDEWITNRKTDRRQAPRRSTLQRLHDLNDKCARRFQSQWPQGVRLGFALPKDIAAFVADGNHGLGVNVFQGFVHVAHGSAEECFVSAAEFLAVIARNKPAFTRPASIISNRDPSRSCGRWLSVVNGALVVCGGIHEPRIFEAKAS
jgi:hypothetical protein